ncbi:MAG: hypothetical protein ACK55I_04845 [bacterium]
MDGRAATAFHGAQRAASDPRRRAPGAGGAGRGHGPPWRACAAPRRRRGRDGSGAGDRGGGDSGHRQAPGIR